MLRVLCLFSAMLLLAPAAASAAPFGEAPFQPVAGTATCVRATGAPGEFVRGTSSSIELLQATAAGLQAGPVLPTADIDGCPEVASARNGAGVVAYAEDVDDEQFVYASLREPGWAWGTEQQLAVAPAATTVDLAAAASERGDALVAFGYARDGGRATVVVRRRAPGEGFGAPVTLASVRRAGFRPPTVRAAMTSSGEAIVAWELSSLDSRELWVATAPAGGAFGKPVRVAELSLLSAFDLAVAPDGRALLAYHAGEHLYVAEREPGAGWGEGAQVATAGEPIVPALALRADGAAVVVWGEFVSGATAMRARERPGSFSAPVVLNKPTRTQEELGPLRTLMLGLLSVFGGEIGFFGADDDLSGGNPRALYMADGRALVAWQSDQRGGGAPWTGLRVALVGSTVEHHLLGGPLRDAGSFALAGSTPVMVWTDNDHRERNGRVHLAGEGFADAPEAAPPEVRLGTPAPRLTGDPPAVRIPVTCSAACDVRAAVAGSVDATASISLPAAGTGRLVLASEEAPIAPLKPGPVRIHVRSGGPGARRPQARTITPILSSSHDAYPVPIRGLSARREGEVVIVRWRAAEPASPDAFDVTGRDRADDPVTRVPARRVAGARNRFEARLRDPKRAVRTVVVASSRSRSLLSPGNTARVRG